MVEILEITINSLIILLKLIDWNIRSWISTLQNRSLKHIRIPADLDRYKFTLLVNNDFALFKQLWFDDVIIITSMIGYMSEPILGKKVYSIFYASDCNYSACVARHPMFWSHLEHNANSSKLDGPKGSEFVCLYLMIIIN